MTVYHKLDICIPICYNINNIVAEVNMNNFEVGTKVCHEKFGDGTVYHVSKDCVKVDFDGTAKTFNDKSSDSLKVTGLTSNQKRLKTLKEKSDYSPEEWNNKYRFQEKYAQTNGLSAKTYKLNKELADRFKEVCNKIGKSQSSALTELMTDFIDKNS